MLDSSAPTTVTARAPGRVNLIGEHTDYNGGLCLPVALPDETTVAATPRDDDVVRLTSGAVEGACEGRLSDLGPGRVTGWAAYAAGVLWVLAADGVPVPGCDLHVESTVPLGAGLSSSAALEAAVAVAVWGLLDRPLHDDTRALLAEVCRRAETEVVGAPTGGLDQAAVLRVPAGGAVLLDFAAGASDPVTPVRFDLPAAGLALTVVDTRVSHTHSDSDEAGYGARRRECEDAARALGVETLSLATPAEVEECAALVVAGDDVLRRRARHVVTENARVTAVVAALDAGDWRTVGALLSASHVSMRDDFEISCPELDLAVATALDAGALGARMTGGGFGGSAVALVPAERVDAVRRAVDAAFAREGFGAPGHLDGTPSAPASLLP